MWAEAAAAAVVCRAVRDLPCHGTPLQQQQMMQQQPGM
jgi:hypothetical protein